MNKAQSKWVEEVYQKYRAVLMAQAVNILKDSSRAQDIVQDVFVKLGKQDRGKISSYVAPWLFRVCRNQCLKEAYRWDNRMVSLKQDSDGELEGGQQTFANHYGGGVASGEDNEVGRNTDREYREFLYDKTDEAITTLTLLQQKVLEMRYHHGLTYREIENQIGVKEGYVGFILNEAKAKLRKKLRKFYGE